MADIAKLIIDHLESEGITGLVQGSEKPASTSVPQKAIFVQVRGGPPPDGFLDGGEKVHSVVNVQCMARTEPLGEKDGHDRATSIIEALRNTTPTGLDYVHASNPRPIPLGPDDDDVYRFTANFQANLIES